MKLKQILSYISRVEACCVKRPIKYKSKYRMCESCRRMLRQVKRVITSPIKNVEAKVV